MPACQNKAIDGDIEKVYFRCTKCGEIKLLLSRHLIESGEDKLNQAELVAVVLAGKVKVVDRKCDKCYALSYDVYTGGTD